MEYDAVFASFVFAFNRVRVLKTKQRDRNVPRAIAYHVSMTNVLLTRGAATAIVTLLTLTMVGCGATKQPENGATNPVQDDVPPFVTSEFGAAAFPTDRGEY